MDMKKFYSRVRELEAAISGRDAVIISEATPDGGRAGVYSEVPRCAAARLVAEGRARLATAEEAESYRAKITSEFQRAEEQKKLNRPTFTVLSDEELETLHSALKGRKRTS